MLELVHLENSEDGEAILSTCVAAYFSQRLGISDYENLAADASHLDANVWLEIMHLESSEDREQ